jgi:hypothetical protein
MPSTPAASHGAGFGVPGDIASFSVDLIGP